MVTDDADVDSPISCNKGGFNVSMVVYRKVVRHVDRRLSFSTVSLLDQHPHLMIVSNIMNNK